MEIYTIGFAGHTAEQFFSALESHGVAKLLDVRLNNVSQLAGFTKRDDLRYFLSRHGIGYRHDTSLAPTPELLRSYRSKQIPWPTYEERFLDLMRSRHVDSTYTMQDFITPTALLCSEHGAQRCHRRLVVEYLQSTSIPQLVPVHL